ncbi:MAG: ABC transporter ATP-binding protein [Rhodanobacter sp.]
MMRNLSPLLRVQGLVRRIGEHRLLDGIDLQLHRGELLGLIGANGSGKTTLIRCIAGLIPWDAGDIAIDGRLIRQDLTQARMRLGYAVAPGLLPEVLTGQQCLQLFAATRGLDAVPAATLELAEALRLNGVLYAMIGRYSLGMRQKLSLCLALLGEPPLLLLDESLHGLDSLSAYTAKQTLIELVRRERCAVILATHMLDSTQACMTRVTLLHAGRIDHEWSAADLQLLHDTDGASLERAMVEQLRVL